MEGKYRPQQLGQKEYYELGKIVSLMLGMCRPIFGTGKDVVLDSSFCVAKCIIELEAKRVYAEALTKKWRYWTNRVPGCWGVSEIHPHMKFVRTEEVRMRTSTRLLGPE